MHAEVIIILKRRIVIIDKIMVAQMVGVDDMGLCFSTCGSKSLVTAALWANELSTHDLKDIIAERISARL